VPPASVPPASLRPARPPGRGLTQLAARLSAAGALAAPAPGEGRADAATAVITGITHDSRQVLPGDLYAALPGARAHGADFAAQAASAGAVAALTDAAGAPAVEAAGLTALVADDPRARLGDVASWIYGDPSRRLLLLGVTGTNGKTTTAYLLEAGLRAAGHVTGLIGTVETRVGRDTIPSARTTPEAPDLQALLAVMAERGATAAAMEVSSHALALGRVAGTSFAGAAFTNLTQDHLDFHGTLESYFAAKRSLFTGEALGGAGAPKALAANADDAFGGRLVAEIAGCRGFAASGAPADWRARDVRALPDGGSSFAALGPDGARVEVEIQLPGAFNVANALGALALLAEAGVPLEAAAAGIGALDGVPGRMQRVTVGQPFLALVDYAHTPDAVDSLLAALRPLTDGAVIAVLGCGGDRDRGKRPLMGAAVARGADVAVLTSDNPRSEDPLEILAAMRAGADGVPPGERGEVVAEPDRAAAIALAVRRARPGDVVVVAGKGHERGQERDGVVTPFDDREQLRTALGALGAGR
jgi:UDP-N-acetylmuramoyl-L-alanyl-D-glutamate--2,6-diaminopimelate ligase